MNHQDSVTDLPATPVPVALSALVLLAHYHGIAANPANIAHRFALEADDLQLNEWLLAAKELGLKARLVSHSPERLHLLALPALV